MSDNPKEAPQAQPEGTVNAGASADVQRRQQRLSNPMPLGFIYKTLTQNLESDRLMKDLVIYIPFVIVFVFFFLAQRNVESEFYYAQGLRDHMYGQELLPTNPIAGSEPNGLPYFFKNYAMIGNEPEWYDYVEAVLTPQMFVDKADNTPGRAIIGQVYPIGALRFRAKHVRNNSCTPNKHVYPTDNVKEYPRPCYAEFNHHVELRDVPLGRGTTWWNYTDENCEGSDGSWGSISGQYGTYTCGGYVVDIPTETNVADALKIARSLRNGGFAHVESVRALIIEMVLYNSALDTFINVKLFTEITEGGGFIPQQRFRPFHVSDNDGGWVVYTMFFLCFVLYFWVKFIQDARRFYRIERKLVPFFFDIWNFLEFVNLVILLVLFVVYYVWWSMSADVDVKFPARNEMTNVSTSFLSPQFPPQNGFKYPTDREYSQQLNTVAEVFQVAIYLSSLNTVLLFLKVLKFLRLNNRLNILSRTMESVAQSIMGVLAIFCWVVFSYTIAAHHLYGTGIYEFRNTDEAFAALFRILVGDFDYDGMREESRGLTFVFFWSFVIIGLFILLNFVVAVVMNGFDEENAKQRPVPLDIVISDTMGQMRKALREKGMLGILTDYLLSSNDGQLHEFIGTYMTTTRMTREMDSDNSTADEDAIVAEIEAMHFKRKDIDRIMPKSEVEAMGDDKIDNIWCDIATEYENTTLADEATKVANLKDTVFESSVEGVTRVLVKHQRKLFGNGEKETDSRRSSRSNSRRSSFRSTSSSIKKRGDDNAFDFSDWNDGSGVLNENEVILSNGEKANSTSDVINDVEARVAAIEGRYLHMNELAQVMIQKVELLKA